MGIIQYCVWLVVITWGLLAINMIFPLVGGRQIVWARRKHSSSHACMRSLGLRFSHTAHFRAFLNLIYSTGDISVSYGGLKWKIFWPLCGRTYRIGGGGGPALRGVRRDGRLVRLTDEEIAWLWASLHLHKKDWTPAKTAAQKRELRGMRDSLILTQK